MAGFAALCWIWIPRLVGRGRDRCRGRHAWLWHVDARPQPGVHDAREIDDRDSRSGGVVGIRASLLLYDGASANAGAVLAHHGLARVAFRAAKTIRGSSPLPGRRRVACTDCFLCGKILEREGRTAYRRV